MPQRRDDIPGGEDLHALAETGHTHAEIAFLYDCAESTISKRIWDATHDAPRKDRVTIYAPWEPTAWIDRAACAQIIEPEVFFPHHGMSEAMAKAVCKGCPVQTACLTEALEHNEQHGIFGGLNADERRALLKASA